jgi:hypothetical protein
MLSIYTSVWNHMYWGVSERNLPLNHWCVGARSERAEPHALSIRDAAAWASGAVS